MVAGEVKFIAPAQLQSWTVASEHFAHWGRSTALSRIRFRASERTYWRTQSHHCRLGRQQSCRYQNLPLALIYQIKFAFVLRHAWPHFFKTLPTAGRTLSANEIFRKHSPTYQKILLLPWNEIKSTFKAFMREVAGGNIIRNIPHNISKIHVRGIINIFVNRSCH